MRVGAAAVEMTPSLCDDAVPDATIEQYDSSRGCFRWVHLAGFGPYLPFQADNRLAEGAHDPLWARALAVEGANGDTVVLVSTDLPGLGAKHANQIRRRVERGERRAVRQHHHPFDPHPLRARCQRLLVDLDAGPQPPLHPSGAGVGV